MADSRSIDQETHETAVRLAVQCRRIIQAVLREEEWIDCDHEFYIVIYKGLEQYRAGNFGRESGTT
jgi:hypothetical protein